MFLIFHLGCTSRIWPYIQDYKSIDIYTFQMKADPQWTYICLYGHIDMYNIWNVISRGPSWPWSYGSWIYNYLCNQCLSPLMLWVRISNRARGTTLCDKVCLWLATVRWFFPGSAVSSTNKMPRYNWNIVESGVIHHHTNNKHVIPSTFQFPFLIYSLSLSGH